MAPMATPMAGRTPAGRAVRRLLALGAAVVSVSQIFAPAEEVGFANFLAASTRDVSAVARQAELKPAPAKYGASRYPGYDGYVYRRKMIPHIRLRLDRWGTGHWPFYRIKAMYQKRPVPKSGRFLESLGWWDPMKELDDPKAFKLRLDRCVFWLRNGGQPTDMVANLLDRVGIIRRLGPLSKRGEWEWRVPKDCGPEAPEGWSYDGPQEVTWANKPRIRHQKNKPHNPKKAAQTPLIERYGFKGYTKVPVDFEDSTMPVDGSSLLASFPNTELPAM